MAKMRAHCAKSFQISKTILGLSALLVSSTVFGAGFQIQEQNAVYLGTAYSGTAAWAADASTAFYNPAGLTHVKGKQLVASGVLIWGSFDFEPTRTNMPLFANTPVPGDSDVNPGGIAAIPTLHYSAQVLDDWWFGLSIAPPFGLKSEYDEGSIMRYVATRSELRTIDIIPSLAWRATDWLSLAAGPDFLFADAILDIKTNATNGAAGTAFDGFQKNRASDWAFGWHAGVLIDFNECARVGIQYRSKFSVGGEGDSRNHVPFPTATTLAGVHATRRVQAQVTLPETVNLSGYYEVSPSWALMADVAWAKWSRFENLTLHYNPPSTPALDTNTPEHFKNTWRLAVGANYTFDDAWQFRGGVAWDQSPVRAEHRTARIPDSDRVWVGLGAGYSMLECLHLDFSYAHLFFEDSRLSDRGVHSVATGNPVFAANLVEGNYSPNANIFGVQVRYDFV